MAGNTIGTLFRVTTWGESHGPALGAVIDGCPPGIEIGAEEIQAELESRRPGVRRSDSARAEKDTVEILSGVFEGRTTGTPISLVVRNTGHIPADYDSLRGKFRPGHGDFTYRKKYGIRDHRGGGRASGRETVARVAAGAVARKIIGRAGVSVFSFTAELGGVPAVRFSPEFLAGNSLRCPDPEALPRMEERLNEARAAGDSIGGIAEIRVRNCPPGLGEPVFGKIDADLAGALMGIGTVKGVEIGAGLAAARMSGSQCNDPITPGGFASNHAGGILAGITNGEEIVIRAACKPIPSIAKPQETIDLQGKPVRLEIRGRHDVSVIPRILPVCEAMVCIVVADHLLRQKAVRNGGN